MKRIYIFVIFLFFASCQMQQGPIGIAQSPLCAGDCGPAVVFDPTVIDNIKVPFPNDIFCSMDPESPTKCRLNFPTNRPTKTESNLMRNLNKLDGFSTYGPIVVQFNGKIDPSTANSTTIFVINIDPTSEGFGERVPLDLGKGDFPVRMDRPYPLFAGDPYSKDMSLIIPDDNKWDVNLDGVKEFVNYYNIKTSTLIIRPRIPMRAATKYAVILTKGVKGFAPDGSLRPIHSPLPWVNTPSQTPALNAGWPAITRWGIGKSDIAFAWTFTTGSITRDIDLIRAGLYGKGPFKGLKNRATKGFAEIHNTGITFDGDGSHKDMPKDPHDNMYILQGEYVEHLMNMMAAFFPDAKNYHFNNIDYVVFGEISSINLRATSDHIWHIDPEHKRIAVRDYKIPFMLTVPKATKHHKPPFPVVLYAHGNQTSRFELLLFANYIAQFGLAGLVVDEIGHGPLVDGLNGALVELARQMHSDVTPKLKKMVVSMLASVLLPNGAKDVQDMDPDEALDKLQNIGIVKELTHYGRAYDMNHDGILTNGEGFFVPNPFVQRDIFRQMVVDYLVLARLVSSLNQKYVPPAFKGDPQKASYEELYKYFRAGDFNTDGVLDIGGSTNPLYMAGISLGGINTVLVTGYEPMIKAATPFVAGGGIIDILMRSTLRERLKPGLYFQIGPVLSTCKKDGYLYFFFNDDLDFDITDHGAVCKGDLSNAAYRVYDMGYLTISATNMSNGYSDISIFSKDGLAWVALPSDKGDLWQINLKEKSGRTVTFEVMTPYSGLGVRRNSHKFIAELAITETILSSCDPVNLAGRILWHPQKGIGPRNILQEALVGDFTVPVATQVALARSAGLLGFEKSQWSYWDDLMARIGLIKGKKDIDFDDEDSTGDGYGPVPPIRTDAGMSAVRFANAHGKHEYMASPNPGSKNFDIATYHLNQAAIYLGSGGHDIIDDPCISRPDCPILLNYK